MSCFLVFIILIMHFLYIDILFFAAPDLGLYRMFMPNNEDDRLFKAPTD